MTLVLYVDVPENDKRVYPMTAELPGGPRIRYAAPDAQRCQGAVPAAGGGYYRCTFTALAGEALCGHHRNAVRPTLRDIDRQEHEALNDLHYAMGRLHGLRARRRHILRVVAPDYAD